MNAATEPGVVAHALHALADHIATHQLPTPAEIQIDHDTRRLELHLSGHDAGPWLRSLQGSLDDVQLTPAAQGSPLQWVNIDGRLPDTGVRVQLQWIRRVVEPVPA